MKAERRSCFIHVASFALAVVLSGPASVLAAPCPLGPDTIVSPDAHLVAAGDFDGSLGDDVAVTAAGGVIEVYLSRPDGTLELSGRLGSGATFVAAADLDGDGLDDLVSTELASVLVHRSVGDGTFEAPARHALQSWADLLLVGQFHDGPGPDIFVARVGGQDVLPNLGDGTLGGAIMTATIGSSRHGAAADVDGDGLDDVMLADGRGFSVQQALGDGTFADPETTDLLGWPGPVATGDFDGDGLPDAAVLEASEGLIEIFTIDSGVPRSVAFVPSPSIRRSRLRVAELDGMAGPGLLDLAYLDSHGALVVVPGEAGFAFGDPLASADAFGHVDLALVDVDADGVLDAVVTNPDLDHVAVHRGSGTGTFVTAPAPAWALTGWVASDLAAADLDGANGPDLVVGHEQSRDVSVVRRAPDGGWLPETRLGDGTRPWQAVSADFDGDGVLDVAVSMDGSGGVAVALGDGGGGFAAERLFPAGEGAGPLAAADLDADSLPDLVVLDGEAQELVVLRNLGGASFAAPMAWPAAGRGRALAVADFDGRDGLDVAVGFTFAPGIELFFNDGTGRLSGRGRIELEREVIRLRAIDFDRAGGVDLVTVGGVSVGSVVLLGDGVGGFTPGPVISGWVRDLEVADVDGDGWSDVVRLQSITSPARGSVQVHRNMGGAGFDARVITEIAGPVTALAVGDVVVGNGPDVVVSGPDETVQLLVNDGAGTLAEPASFATIGAASHVAVARWTADDAADLVAVSRDAERAALLESDGLGGLRDPRPFLGCDGVKHVALADLDGAAGVDVVAANGACESVRTWRNAGDGTFGASMAHPVGTFAGRVRAADVTGDGRADVIVACPVTGEVRVLAGLGGGALGPAVAHAACAGAGASDLALVDLDGANGLDVGVACHSYSSVALLLNDGTGDFSPPTLVPMGLSARRIAFADLDGVAPIDLAAHDGGWNVATALATGPASYAPASRWSASGRPGTLVSLDVDEDGDIDLAIGDGTQHGVLWLLNDGAGGFGTHLSMPIGMTPKHLVAADFDDDGRLELAVADTRRTTTGGLLGRSAVAIAQPCVAPPPWLLRDDSITSLAPLSPSLSTVFASFDLEGPDGVPMAGEGPDPTLPGTADDDAAYLPDVPTEIVDPDPTVGRDPSRPLVFYRLSGSSFSLRVSRNPDGTLRLSR